MDVRLNLKSDGLRLYPVSDESMFYIQSHNGQELELIVSEIEGRVRTPLQNKSMHKYFQEVADELNGQGVTLKVLLKEMRQGFDIPLSKTIIKELMWKPILESMNKKESTTDQTTVETQEVYLAMNKWLADHYGISVDWPSLR